MTKEKPKLIQDAGFDFSWSPQKVWSLDVLVENMPLEDVAWHLGVPFWNTSQGYYDLTPAQVMNDPETYKEEYDRAMGVDQSHPIDIMWNKGRWLILDGLHRLVKARIEGRRMVNVRKIPHSKISEIST